MPTSVAVAAGGGGSAETKQQVSTVECTIAFIGAGGPLRHMRIPVHVLRRADVIAGDRGDKTVEVRESGV